MDGKTKLERMIDSLDSNVDAIFDKCCDDLERSRYQLTNNTFKFRWKADLTNIVFGNGNFNANVTLNPEMVHQAMVQYYKAKILKFFGLKS